MGRISREAAGQCVDSVGLQGILWPGASGPKCIFENALDTTRSCMAINDKPFVERHAAGPQLLCSRVASGACLLLPPPAGLPPDAVKFVACLAQNVAADAASDVG